MKKFFKKSLAFLVALMMLIGMIPTTVMAAVDGSGKPIDLANKIVLSIYTPEGQFPGEPAVYGTSNYKSFKSDFTLGTSSFFSNAVVFKDSAETELDPSILDNLVEGAHSNSTTVWGAYDANGMKRFFRSDSTIINRNNEIKMIRAIKNISEAEAKNYEIIWYVIKLQHTTGFLGTTEWHIDGVIKEIDTISINYYGNGNTSGDAPLGVTNHIAGDDYTVLGKNTLKRVVYGAEVDFLGWSAKSDGTGAEAGFYQPGDVINPKESISLYAMWDTTTQHNATVYTYLDHVLVPATAIHDDNRELYLSSDEVHYYKLTEESTGVYSVNITGNGKFHLYFKEADETEYGKFGSYQLTLYNSDASLEVHHFTVNYDTNGGEFANEPHNHGHGYGESVNAITEVPTREGYAFIGWEKENGDIVYPGQLVTNYITEKINLTAIWEKNVSVTVNVTIDHRNEDGGYNTADTKEMVNVALVAREDSTKPYLETGDVLTLSSTEHNGFTYSAEYAEGTDEVTETKYISNGATYENMPGGDVEYTVVASKSYYDTKVTSTQDDEGNWVIDVVMTYKPISFDLDFTVTVDETVPERYVPSGAIVRLACWVVEDNEWQIITQHSGDVPGVRIDIDKDTREGSGSYPVWRYTPVTNEPYGYRLVVTAFIYPDGTIMRANELDEDVSWTDGAYIATMDEVADGKAFGTLDGAYFENNSDIQHGKLNANITIEIFDVIFDAMGGTVNGYEKQLVPEQLRIPTFEEYVPTRDGGYIFDGWYLDEAYETAAVAGKALYEDTTLYAKWIAPLTISGTVTVSGTYMLNGQRVFVKERDRAVDAEVILQQIHGEHVHDVNSKVVKFGSYSYDGSADYAFTGIPNDGKSYQIKVVELNYTTTYDNETDSETSFSPDEYTAIFGNDNIAEVDAYLEFAPDSYEQFLNVDATAISEGFRPSEVLSEVIYRDLGNNHTYEVVSQHTVEPYGVEIALNDGIGRDSMDVWNWHTDGQLYLYQMNVTSVDGTAFDSDFAPFEIIYDAPAYWDAVAGKGSSELKATLVPKVFAVIYDINAEGDTVTGMDAYLQADGSYLEQHKWSYETPINAVPVREGYKFLGWEADDAAAYDGSKIGADVAKNVTLTAIWAEADYTVTTQVQGNGTTTGDGTYENGTVVTLTAEPAQGNVFVGWRKENGEFVTGEKVFTHTVTENITFIAYFEKASGYKNNYAYIFGYNDTEMGAEGPLLRSELSVMVHRLVKQNGKLGDFVYNAAAPSFADIQGEWFQSGIEFMHHKGAFTVAEGGYVQPYIAVTRGEAFKVVALGLGFTEDTTLTNAEYANLLFELGYIIGDENGNLDVNGAITRAQFCTMYNRIIGRENALLIDAEGNEITAETYGFTDLNDPEAWYYKAMVRATSAYDDAGFVDLSLRGIRNDLDDYGN